MGGPSQGAPARTGWGVGGGCTRQPDAVHSAWAAEGSLREGLFSRTWSAAEGPQSGSIPGDGSNGAFPALGLRG